MLVPFALRAGQAFEGDPDGSLLEDASQGLKESSPGSLEAIRAPAEHEKEPDAMSLTVKMREPRPVSPNSSPRPKPARKS
jgi:hypothetical protein